MSDEIDRASDAAEADREALVQLQLARAARQAQPPRLAADGTRLCVDCGEPITLARLAALPHATACIDCASDAEARHRHYLRKPWAP